MATITANTGAGNWNVTGTWVGGVIPGVDDEAVIPSGATVTVPTGVTVTIGQAAAPTVRCVQVGGTLIVNGTLRANADAGFTGTTGVVQVNAGGVIESANTTTALTWWNNGGELRLRGTGPASGRAIVRRGAGSAGLSYRRDDANTTRYWTKLDSEWGRFDALGSSSVNGIEVQGLFGDDPVVNRLRDTLVDGCGEWTTSGFNYVAAFPLDWERVRFKNSAGSQCLTLFGSAEPTATRRMVDVAFDRFAVINVSVGMTFQRVLFRDRVQLGNNQIPALFEDVVLADQAPAGNAQLTFGSITRGIRVRVNPSQGNWHGIQPAQPTGVAEVTLDGILFDGVVSDESGDLIVASAPGTPFSVRVRNLLATRASTTNGSYGKLVSLLGNANFSVPVVENCTAFTSNGDESGIIAPGETFAGYAGMVPVVRNNLAVGLTPGTGTLVLRQSAGAAANQRDLVTPAGITNNAVRNAAAGGVGIGVGNRTVSGGDGVMFTTTPAAPLDVDPQFVDAGRNLATWYRSLVGGTPGTRAADTLLALDAMASQWDDAPVAGGTITAAYDWIRAGYAPQNVALKTDVSANNGGWIGAVEGIAPPPPVPIADTIRIVGGGNPPWHPAAGPTVGVPYTFTLEAWDSVSLARDTAITGNVTLGIDFVAGDNVVVQSGPTTVAWSSGLATFANVVFAEAPPPFDPRIPGGGRNPGGRAGLARFLAQNPNLARALRTGKNPKGR